jgi:hypothetical protein
VRPSRRFALALLLLLSLLLFGTAISLRSSAQDPTPASTEQRAVAFLSQEVPRWRREHACYSCHNNGDAVRALVAASSRGHDVRAAIDDSLRWLSVPSRWNSNAGGEGGGDDKRLARIQFATAAVKAADASLVPADAVAKAAAIVAADQHADGGWRLDSSDSLGSPATYGTALATAFARRVLVRAKSAEYTRAIERADGWLRTVKPSNTPDASAILFGMGTATDEPGRTLRASALEFLKRGQAPEGGWGPYSTVAAEPFDTAVAILALSEVDGDARPAFTREELRRAIERGRAYLARQQERDGSWVETTRPSGQESYAQRISTSAWALLALFETRGIIPP